MVAKHSQKSQYTWLLIIPLIALVFSPRRKCLLTWAPIVEPLRLRSDSLGDGKFGASRSGGSRKHQGFDLIVTPGQKVYAPFKSKLIRQASPYNDDTRFTGVLLQGLDEWSSYTVKIFYMVPTVTIGSEIDRGDQIGQAQAISTKYGSSMLNHIHVEVRKDDALIDPAQLIYG